MYMISKLVAAGALAVSLVGAVQAQNSIAVKVSDLDLASTDGQKRFKLRIGHAAAQLCASEGVRQSPQMIRAESRCKAAAKRSVEQQVAARTGVRTAAD